jgi:hypothetical protein
LKPDLLDQHARLKSQYPVVILLLNWLIALVLFALVVCPAALLLAVVTASIVAAVASCPFVRTDCGVAVRFARDTARSAYAEDKEQHGMRQGCWMCRRWVCDGGRGDSERAGFVGGRCCRAGGSQFLNRDEETLKT